MLHTDFPSPCPAAGSPMNLDGVIRLTHWGVIDASGADAARFLHGQLTQDMVLMANHEARLAAYCSAKGRMLASFVAWKPQADTVRLACSADLLPSTLKRLTMFVLRAACRLSDASNQVALWGVAGPTADALARQVGLESDVWSKTEAAGDSATARAMTLVRLPPALGPEGPVTRLLCCTPTTEPLTPPVSGPELSLDTWQWAEVRSGVATLTAPLSDTLVPQMLNYESVGGVNFKKGCYPGQEVVARSQFRGTLKRRTVRVVGNAPLAVGNEIFHRDDPEQPCGTVAVAAATPNGTTWEALACLQVAATSGGTLHLGHMDGPVLTLQPLPYRLLEDI